MTDAELDRERNDLYFGNAERVNYGDVGATPNGERYREPLEEEPEPGRFGFRLIYPDGVEIDAYGWDDDFPITTRGQAIRIAQRARENLAYSTRDPRVAIISLETGEIIDEETT